MRLIDADKLRKDINCAYSDDLEICEKIDAQPTAYDIGKVVSELKTDSSGKLYGSINSENYLIPVKRAIEIVKQGGVSDDACEWEYKHPFGDFPSCKNVNSISRDMNWKYCPYCGKKIKIKAVE